MAVRLKKGGDLSLSNAAPSLKRILVGLGWAARVTEGVDFDLDASAFMLTDKGRVRGDEDLVFYGQLRSLCGSVIHTGDDRSGGSEGDDEALEIDLQKVPADISRILICVTIYEAERHGQNFGQVSDAFIRVVDQETNAEIARFDLTEDYSTETGMIFGEIYRDRSGWRFKAVGEGNSGGLEGYCHRFGVEVA